MYRAFALVISFVISFSFVNSYAQHGGTLRWQVKTLSDPDTSAIRFDSIVKTSVRALKKLPKYRTTDNTPRLIAEIRVYQVTASLYGYKSELDGDYHLVLQDDSTSDLMIAEIPNPDSEESKRTGREATFRSCREMIDSIYGPARMMWTKKVNKKQTFIFTGVALYDTPHFIPQTGMMESRLELHPLLSIVPIEKELKKD